MPQKLTFGNYVEQFPEKVRNIALNLRVLVLKKLPHATEKVHPGMKWVVYGIPRSIVAIKPEEKQVSLYFFEGIKLRDPDHVLKGSGTRLRYIPVDNIEKSKKILGDFLEQAYFLHIKRKI